MEKTAKAWIDEHIVVLGSNKKSADAVRAALTKRLEADEKAEAKSGHGTYRSATRSSLKEKRAPYRAAAGYTCEACGASGLGPDEMSAGDGSRCFDC